MSSSQARVLSKSRYLAGHQCAKRIWNEVRRPDIVPSYSASVRAVFEQGHEVGAVAQRLFPGGVEIDDRSFLWPELTSATVQALRERVPLYEAAFVYRGAGCRADILVPVGEDHWDLVEVKSSTSVQPVHLRDLAFQTFVIEGCGLHLQDISLLYIDSRYIRNGEIDPERLFVRRSLGKEVRDLVPEVEGEIARQIQLLTEEEPQVGIGEQCDAPYECPLKPNCWSFLPPGNVFELCGPKRVSFDLLRCGVTEIVDIPSDFPLSDKQQRQLESIRRGTPFVDKDRIRDFLAQLEYPLSFFDIETVTSAIPLFEGVRPYQQVPFLLSVHRRETEERVVRHFVHSVDPGADPRPAFLRAAHALLGEKGSIVVYHAPFERRVLEETSAAAPELANWVRSLQKRYLDLHVPFRSFDIVDPDQKGRTSLKAVLPALTELDYTDLEIKDGQAAGRAYLQVLRGDLDPLQKLAIKRQIEEYCSRDTLALAVITERLQQIVED